MPKLVKGGKYVFGWSLVRENGRVVVPPEALDVYGFTPGSRLFLIPGSKKSGGFSLTTYWKLRQTPVGRFLEDAPEFSRYLVPEGKLVDVKGKKCCWVWLKDDGSMDVPAESLVQFDVHVGDRILVVRGSRIGIGFPVRGPIIEEASNHPEVEVF